MMSHSNLVDDNSSVPTHIWAVLLKGMAETETITFPMAYTTERLRMVL